MNHALPAWDVCCGLYAALAVSAAVRRRESRGEGAQLRVALEDVALATAGNLGLLTEPQVNGTQRARLGNAIFGQYGQDFTSSDGVSFMVVALTARHFSDLVEVTGTAPAVSAVASAQGDFAAEGHRYRYREVLSALFAAGSARTRPTEIADALSATTVLFERYRTSPRWPPTTGCGEPVVRPDAPDGHRRIPRARDARLARRKPPGQHAGAEPGADTADVLANARTQFRRHRPPPGRGDNRLLTTEGSHDDQTRPDTGADGVSDRDNRDRQAVRR